MVHAGRVAPHHARPSATAPSPSNKYQDIFEMVLEQQQNCFEQAKHKSLNNDIKDEQFVESHKTCY